MTSFPYDFTPVLPAEYDTTHEMKVRWKFPKKKAKILKWMFEGDQCDDSTTGWSWLWAPRSHWICGEGWQKGDDPENSKSEGHNACPKYFLTCNLGDWEGHLDRYLSPFGHHVDPRDGSYRCSRLLHDPIFHPDLAHSQRVRLWGRSEDRHRPEVLLPRHGLAGTKGHDRKHHCVWKGSG